MYERLPKELRGNVLTFLKKTLIVLEFCTEAFKKGKVNISISNETSIENKNSKTSSQHLLNRVLNVQTAHKLVSNNSWLMK